MENTSASARAGEDAVLAMDVALLAANVAASLEEVHALLDAGRVTLNGVPSRAPDETLYPGDVLIVEGPTEPMTLILGKDALLRQHAYPPFTRTRSHDRQ